MDIFETNLINILIFVIGLFFIGKKFLNEILSERQNRIISTVQDSEKRFNDATNRLNEAKKQLSQARVIIANLDKETRLTKSNLLKNEYNQTKIELNRRFLSATTTLKNRERLILSEIKQNISLIALKQVLSTLEKQTGSEDEHVYYMEESIKMIGGL